MRYEYRLDINANGEVNEAVTTENHFLGKLNHEIFNISQWLPPNVMIDIKLTLASSNFILKPTNATAPEVTDNLTSAILHVKTTGFLSMSKQ